MKQQAQISNFNTLKALKIINELKKGFPIIGITGPRQSGKTTLAKMAFPEKAYVSLETPSNLDFALNDPVGFLEKYQEGAIIDEAQNAPELFSYLQGIVDENKINGQFVLTGSQQFGLLAGITQSLAGRIGLVELLPLAISELGKRRLELNQQILWGQYPSLYDRELKPQIWYQDYIATYLEKDVRQLINIKDTHKFRRFLKLCAARTGQLLNKDELREACEINSKTFSAWLSILEASYIIHLVPPFFQNYSKRVVKSPKLYFNDTGLACSLLGLNSSEEVGVSSLKGALFETLVYSEVIKRRLNHRLNYNLYFWRDSKGVELDLVFEEMLKVTNVEIKSSATIQSDHLKNFAKFSRYAKEQAGKKFLIYGGNEEQTRKDIKIYPWFMASELLKLRS